MNAVAAVLKVCRVPSGDAGKVRGRSVPVGVVCVKHTDGYLAEGEGEREGEGEGEGWDGGRVVCMKHNYLFGILLSARLR